jgi:hypothetical protein
MTKIKNPLSKMVSAEQVEKMFGKSVAKAIMEKPVYKYTHKSTYGEGFGDMRNSKN